MSDKSKPAIDAMSVEARTGSSYPAPFDADCAGRERRRLGDVFGLTQFGVNLLRLPPGQWSSQRHWHHGEDEFVYVLEGEAVLITDAGEQVLGPGMAAGFKARVQDGHHLVNRSEQDVLVLEVGTRTDLEPADYPDIDLLMRIVEGEERFVHKDGTPYPK